MVGLVWHSRKYSETSNLSESSKGVIKGVFMLLTPGYYTIFQSNFRNNSELLYNVLMNECFEVNGRRHTKIANLEAALDYIGCPSLEEYAGENGFTAGQGFDLSDEDARARIERVIIREARDFRDWAEDVWY
jgi:hypothetical protein